MPSLSNTTKASPAPLPSFSRYGLLHNTQLKLPFSPNIISHHSEACLGVRLYFSSLGTCNVSSGHSYQSQKRPLGHNQLPNRPPLEGPSESACHIIKKLLSDIELGCSFPPLSFKYFSLPPHHTSLIPLHHD
ncbi:hypothetical protein VTL71DRAFT_2998 [Oculimacula yallundae]|uniref:Uncharacterized protein n=1 Tax=Oculimacula yallundae TaxID=86028 RepID=A0ABR4C7S6_9HELO